MFNLCFQNNISIYSFHKECFKTLIKKTFKKKVTLVLNVVKVWAKSIIIVVQMKVDNLITTAPCPCLWSFIRPRVLHYTDHLSNNY